MFYPNQKQDKSMINMGRQDYNKEVAVVEDFLDSKDFKDLMVQSIINIIFSR